MSGLRFIFTLVALLAVFIGGGLVVDHWNRVDTPLTTAPGIAQPEAPLSTPTPGWRKRQRRMMRRPRAPEFSHRKEFDAQAADAVAEAEARSAADTSHRNRDTSDHDAIARPRAGIARRSETFRRLCVGHRRPGTGGGGGHAARQRQGARQGNRRRARRLDHRARRARRSGHLFARAFGRHAGRHARRAQGR